MAEALFHLIIMFVYHIPDDSSRDLFISQLEVTYPLNMSLNHLKKVTSRIARYLFIIDNEPA